jgi:hypothetical protein
MDFFFGLGCVVLVQDFFFSACFVAAKFALKRNADTKQKKINKNESRLN